MAHMIFYLLKLTHLLGDALNLIEKETRIRCVVDLIDEIRDFTHIKEFNAKQRAPKR